MQVQALRPDARLAAFVRQFTVVEAERETTRALLPDAGVAVGFRYGGEARLLAGAATTRLPDASVAGPHRTVRRIRTSAGGGVLLAVFHEGGAAPFFAQPLDELFGATLPLEALLPRSAVERTAACVREAADLAGRVAAFERFLLERLAGGPPDALVAAAVRAIRADPAGIRVGALAARLGLSRDRLEKRVRRAVGTTPKRLASILRLRRAVDGYRAGDGLARLSAASGYFDQSHFVREFRAVTGEPPARFLGAGEHC